MALVPTSAYTAGRSMFFHPSCFRGAAAATRLRSAPALPPYPTSRLRSPSSIHGRWNGLLPQFRTVRFSTHGQGDDEVVTEEVVPENDSPPPKAKKLRKTQLRQDLKDYRAKQAETKPAYTVFTNAALEGIYALLPTSIDELLSVKGIGPKKAAAYGSDILSIVAPYAGVCSDSAPLAASPPPRGPEPIDREALTPEQGRAADLILGAEGRGAFVTGPAGTGKSYLLRFLVQELRRQKTGVAVCAPTGVAAINVGGSTLHAHFGIGLGTGSLASVIGRVRRSADAVRRIDQDILIVDECSMLSSELLETLDEVARAVRKEGQFRDLPFGGMRVIFFGDFFQLPPISREGGAWRPFAFDSPVWDELVDDIIVLKDVQRQESTEFVDLLNKVRVGRLTSGELANLNTRCVVRESHPLPTDGIVPTRLYCVNKDVDSENELRLTELEGEMVISKATDVWKVAMLTGTLVSVKKKMTESLRKEMPDEVSLKVGAQVMLTRNKDLQRNLVNGSRGVVVSIDRSADGSTCVPLVRFDCGATVRVPPVESTRYDPEGGGGCLVRTQVPLRLAWAATIHKSQGTTLTRALLDVSSAFEYAQTYVALSRVRSLEGLWLVRPVQQRNVKVSPQVLAFFSHLEGRRERK
eukprot:CAMPEP_0194276560 /NCGR_PEP_ID=MMETSP0169-20130528/9118_2 /TAXON_ID=218684 /ORGANISM="Corethron pennatum, Strain L29A3" /LENGTH=637 /DNA_ID=CAMNT_0039020301 /DNA_START=117 /DNA_END=2030 /DNA_ORIENTATION=-